VLGQQSDNTIYTYIASNSPPKSAIPSYWAQSAADLEEDRVSTVTKGAGIARNSDRQKSLYANIDIPALPLLLSPPFEKEDKREEDRQNDEKLTRKEKGIQHMTDDIAANLTTKGRSVEDQRDSLSTELRSLSLQADSRARLDLKRAEVRSKTSDAKNM